ncbi:hypothetical protein [Rossellomorea sp. NS-SX7]|uniref:hypothetical protein n=1 Tax=Rossellomorea sp. NS-SX7 TaxID=3463856 RepID=UPI00405A24D1
MNIKFEGLVVRSEKQISSSEVIESIHSLLGESRYFSHMVVDGVEVFEDPENYLIDNIDHINDIEIVAGTVEEFINESLLSAEEYLRRAIPQISLLGNDFYKNPLKETWTNFTQLLEGLNWLNQIIGLIDQTKKKPANWDKYLELAFKLKIELEQLLEAMENSDNVLIGDIIQYEILTNYEELLKMVNETIDTEGYRHDIN